MSHYSKWLNYTSDREKGFERLRVDPDQTSFWEGREFRTFKELNIGVGGGYVVKSVVPTNIILNALSTTLDSGWLRLATVVGGAEGGAFAESLPIFGANNMSGGANHRNDYSGTTFVNTVALTAGGTPTLGTELDVLRVKCAGNSQQGSSVGVDNFDQRGIAPGTYYFRLTNLGNDVITVTFKARYEIR